MNTKVGEEHMFLRCKQLFQDRTKLLLMEIPNFASLDSIIGISGKRKIIDQYKMHMEYYY